MRLMYKKRSITNLKLQFIVKIILVSREKGSQKLRALITIIQDIQGMRTREISDRNLRQAKT
eukprot:403340062